MAESKFTKRMLNVFPLGWGFHFYRIESPTTQPGSPDLFWLHTPSRSTGWAEMKQSNTIEAPSKVSYRPQQPGWLQSYAQAGGRCCTLVHLAKSDRLVWIPGKESVAASTNLRQALGAVTLRLAEPEAWKKVAELLLRG